MAIISGQDAKLQIGKETTWGTAVAPTTQVDFTSESLKQVMNYIEEDTLVGARTTPRMDIAGKKVEGDIQMIVKPDNIGLLLKAALGAEAAVVHIASSVYSHQFSLVAGGTSGSLPKITVVVDRKVAVFGYVSCKVDRLDLEAKVKDYLRATFALRGHSEQADALEALTGSAKRAFQFVDGNITVDGAEYDDVTNVKVSVNNNLEDDLFTMSGSTTMQEIEPQGREVTADLEVLYSSTTNTTRTNKYLTGSTVTVVLNFISTEVAAGGVYYRMQITLNNCYITDASPVVGGRDRIKQNLVVKASEQSSTEPIIVLLINMDPSAY